MSLNVFTGGFESLPGKFMPLTIAAIASITQICIDDKQRNFFIFIILNFLNFSSCLQLHLR